MEKLTVKQKKWDLSALYASHKDDRFIKEMALVETLSAAFEEYRPLLTAEISSIQLIEILNKYEELITLESRLMAYTELWFSEDTQNDEAMTLYAQIESVITEAGKSDAVF
jgi:oligoendopeptidase F